MALLAALPPCCLLPSFWLDLLQVSRHSCVFELLASFPLGCCCVPPANPSSQQAASASKVTGMPRPPFILIESRPCSWSPAQRYSILYTETTLRLDLILALLPARQSCMPSSVNFSTLMLILTWDGDTFCNSVTWLIHPWETCHTISGGVSPKETLYAVSGEIPAMWTL